MLSGLILGFMLLPSKASWSLFSSRRRFCRTLLRVFCAGFVPVLWRDVLLANVLSSLVKPLVDINHALCCAPSAFSLPFCPERRTQVLISLHAVSTDALTESFFEEGQRLESIRLNVPIDDCGCLPGLGYSSAAHACVEGSTTNVTEANACLVRWKTPGE